MGVIAYSIVKKVIGYQEKHVKTGPNVFINAFRLLGKKTGGGVARCMQQSKKRYPRFFYSVS
jgi:hypothetical protein